MEELINSINDCTNKAVEAKSVLIEHLNKMAEKTTEKATDTTSDSTQNDEKSQKPEKNRDSKTIDVTVCGEEIGNLVKNLCKGIFDEKTGYFLGKYDACSDENEKSNHLFSFLKENILQASRTPSENEDTCQKNKREDIPEKTDTPISVKDLLQGLVCHGLVDEKTANILEKFSCTDNDKSETAVEFINHFKAQQKAEIRKDKEEMSSIDSLVSEKQSVDEKMASLTPSEQREFFIKYYNIPTDTTLHNKLDIILEKLEELQSEIAFLRRH